MKKTELILSKGGEELVRLEGVEDFNIKPIVKHISTKMSNGPITMRYDFWMQFINPLEEVKLIQDETYSVKFTDVDKTYVGYGKVKRVSTEVYIEGRFNV